VGVCVGVGLVLDGRGGGGTHTHTHTHTHRERERERSRERETHLLDRALASRLPPICQPRLPSLPITARRPTPAPCLLNAKSNSTRTQRRHGEHAPCPSPPFPATVTTPLTGNALPHPTLSSSPFVLQCNGVPSHATNPRTPPQVVRRPGG